MSDDNRIIETQIEATLFDRRYWASPRWREADPILVNPVSHANDAEPSDRVEITPAEAATCGGIWGHRRYCSDWSLIPVLLEQCAKRDWELSVYPQPWSGEDWIIDVDFTGLDGGHDVRRGEAKTWPLALCRAIVAVLDAMEEVAEETKARES